MSSNGRRLVGPPVLLQDWNDEAEEGAAKYWELFLDLLMVAAASAVADGLKEDPSLQGVNEFAILFFIFVNGWVLYTHHMTTRFEDGTFLHAMILLVFILGNALCIVNASMETARLLAFGALLQRVSVLMMIASIHIWVPRARVFVKKLAGVTILEGILLTLTMAFPQHARVLLWIAVLVELLSEFFLAFTLSREDLVPVNIEHTKDRLGILLLVMLGETVISATIEYRRLAEKQEIENYADYYWVLFWALVLVFFYTLLYFAMSPPPAYHALRRSRMYGCLLFLFHKLMCGSVLAVGAGVKLTIEAVTSQEELSDFAMKLMSGSVGFSMVFLFGMRICHYFGVVPKGTEPPEAIRLFHIWWAFFAIACLLPFFGMIIQVKNPVDSIAMYACILFTVCLVESTFTHILEPYLISDEESRPSNREVQPLATKRGPSYQAT